MKRRAPKSRRPASGANYTIILIYLIGVFIGALDTNVVGPVFPLLMRGLHVSLTWVAWTISAYTVSYVASTVLAGALGDRFGHKRLFRLGILAFGVASAVAALSHVFWLFIVARLIQGAGAGAVYPNAQAEALKQFPPERKGTALGLFGAVFGLASILGPVVGGLLGQFFGWAAVFWVNLPIVAAALFAASRLPASEISGREMPDWSGGLAFSGMLAGLMLALMAGGSARWLFVAAAVLLAGYFWRRQRYAPVPFLDSKPLANGPGVAIMIGAALIGLDMASAVFVPTLAQRTLHFTVFASGLALLPAAFSGAVLSGVGGVMVDRVGPKSVLVIGLVAAAAGGVLLALPHLGMARFMLAMVVMGIGTAFTMGAPLNRIAVALYRDDQAGQALALMAVFRSLGLAVGPIVLTLAAVGRGFTGMYGLVAVASVVGAILFSLIPNMAAHTGRVAQAATRK